MILARPRLISQERFDLEDLSVLLSAARTDSKLYTKEFLSSQNLILKGFTITGLGLHVATMIMADSTLIMPQNSFDFSYFTAAPAEPNITIPASELTVGVRNYIEVSLATQDGTPLTRAFWDPEANSGAGAEFNQQVDTVTDLEIIPVVLTGGFSGLPDRLPVAIMDVDGSGVIKTILDRRELYFRLGKPENLSNQFSWNSRTEPSYSAVLTGVLGTFVDGEILTINTETATCVTGGTTNISWNIPSGINFFPGSTVTGGSSGATGTLSTVQESFTGADKDVQNDHDILTAIMTEIKLMKNSPFWYTLQNLSISGIMSQINSVMVGNTSSAQYSWNGSRLSITDSSVSPDMSDVLGFIRSFGNSGAFALSRQDNTGGSTTLAIGNGQVLFVDLPTSGDRTYSGSGTGPTNFQLASYGSFVPTDQRYWIAFRSGNRLIVRGQGELIAGESAPIGDTIPTTLLNNIGLADEESPPDYSSQIRGTALESIVSRVGVLTDAAGDEQEDRSGYLRSDNTVTWDGTTLTFSSDIILEFINTKTGTLTQHKILAANSPITVTNGNSIWAIIDRTQTSENLTVKNTSINPIPAQDQDDKDVIVFFRRVDAGGVQYLHIPFMKQLLAAGQTVRLGQSGSGSTSVKADYYDPTTTTLPTGVSYVSDGVAVVNGNQVLFSNLSSGNNEIYQVSGVGTSLAWTAQRSFNGQFAPTDGDSVRILSGVAFADRLGEFNGTTFKFNDTVRYFNGADYWEETSLKSLTLVNNTTATVFSVTAAGSENMLLDYSVVRGGKKETGTLHIAQDGTNVSLAAVAAYLSTTTGVSFSAVIATGTFTLSYTTDNQGVGGTLKYSLKRWSDLPGGPGGPPSYAVGGGGGGSGAAGSTGDVQFNIGAGIFGADSRFNIDASDGSFNFNGMRLEVLSSGSVILDNQSSAQTLFTMDQTLYQFAIVEYSIRRNTDAQVGRLLIANNGTLVNISDDFSQTGPVGVTFSAVLSGGFVQVKYQSTNTGFTGTFKCSKRKWN